MALPLDPVLTKLIARRTLAALLDLTGDRIDQLMHQGVFTKVDGKFALQASVNAYIALLKVERSVSTKVAAQNRATTARALEIEARMARESRQVIELDEALAAIDTATGEFIQTLGSMPARITRDPRERQRLDTIFDTERLRLADAYTQAVSAIRSGGGDPAPETETDS